MGYAQQNTQQTVVVQGGYQQPNQVIVVQDEGCCPEAMVDVNETSGLIILILNICTINLGTFVSACIDRKGCNMSAFMLGIAHELLAFVCLIGWVMGIMHGLKVYEHSKGKV